MRKFRGTVPTPPLLTEEPTPPGFKIAPGAVIAWGAYAALRILLLCLRTAPVEATAISELIGELVALFLIPAVFALIIWRVAGRSAKAGNATFFVVLGLAVLGQCSQLAQRAKNTAEFDRIRTEQKKVMAEQRTDLEQGRAIDTTKTEKLIQQAGTQFDEMAKNSSGRERNMAEAGKAYMEELLASKHRYEAAVTGLHAADFWNLASYPTAAATNDRRKAIHVFAQANADLMGYQDANATALRRVVSAHGATASQEQSAVDGYLQSTGARLPFLIKIRECDAQLAQTMLEFLDLTDAVRGKWKHNPTNGKLLLPDQATLTHYNELLKRVDTISKAQKDYQKRAFSVQP